MLTPKRYGLGKATLTIVAWLGVCLSSVGQETVGPWKLAELFAVPQHEPSDQFTVPGLQSLLYTGLAYKGKETRFYAYYGVPEGQAPATGWPAVVLVHGGGGTAGADWVKQWNEHGYAAISMDLEGHLPKPGVPHNERPGHAWSGPHRGDNFEEGPINRGEPVEQHWFYHAVGGIVRADSLLRSFPEVDQDRIGIEGYSWGGVLTSVAIGVDSRFKFGITHTGCGFLHEGDSYLGKSFRRRSQEKLQESLALYEPSSYLPRVMVPMLRTSSPTDVHFPLGCEQKSALATQGTTHLWINVGWGHAGRPEMEPFIFADSVVQGGQPLPTRGELARDGKAWTATFSSPSPWQKAELCYTTDTGPSAARTWQVVPVELEAGKARAELPEGTTVFFFNATDERGCMASSLSRELSATSAELTNEHYGFAYWWNAFRKPRRETSENLLCIETGTYGFMLDIDALPQPRFGLLTDGLGYADALAAGSERISGLEKADLQVTVEHNGTVYRLVGTQVAEDGKLSDVRQWESGQLAQHYDVLGMMFADDAGNRLQCASRFGLVAWPDSLTFRLELEPDHLFADGPAEGVVGNGHCVNKQPHDFPRDTADPAVLTLECWVKSPAALPADGMWYLCRGRNQWTDGHVGFGSGPHIASARMNIGGGRENEHVIQFKGHHFRKQSWNHLVLTYDGKDMKAYVNGHLQGTKTIGKARVPKRGQLRLGQRADGLLGLQAGLYDQVRIWDRVLSPQEVKAHTKRPDTIANRDGLVCEENFEAGVSFTKPSLDDATVRMRFQAGERFWEKALQASGQWKVGEKKTLSLICDISETPTYDEAVAVQVTTPAGKVLAAPFDDRFNCWRVRVEKLKRKRGFNADGLSQMYDDFLIELENRGDADKMVPLALDFRDAFAITGHVPLLCHEDGRPTGLPVQLSKNWHAGSYKRPYMLVPAPPGRQRYILRFVHGFYGSLPSASHAQLCLIGYGGNQRWDQLAVGCGGELITFNPDMSLAAGAEMVCDVRLTMAAYGKNRNPWVWTDAGWGGDWLGVFAGKQKLTAAGMKVAYRSHGPCLSEAQYDGYYGSDRSARLKARIQLPRTDDYGRTYQTVAYEFLRTRSAANSFLMRRHADMFDGVVAYGNGDGLIAERRITDTLKAGDLLVPPTKLEGPAPWWIAFPERSRTGESKDWPIGYVSIVIRAYEESFGGQTSSQPHVQVRIAGRKGNEAKLDTWIVPPPTVKTFQPGDQVSMDTVWLHFVRNAGEFAGFNEAFRAHLEEHPQSWKTTYREVAGNAPAIEVQGGELIEQMPIVIRAGSSEVALTMQGGLAFAPVRFEGLDSTDYAIYEIVDGQETKLDQSAMGNDFWQVEYDPSTGMYAMTFNLPVDGKATSHWVLK